MSKLTDWMRKNPPETVDLTVEDLQPQRGDKKRMESETNSITNRIVFYEGEALRYREAERYAAQSAEECERLAAAYKTGLDALQSQLSDDPDRLVAVEDSIERIQRVADQIGGAS